MKTLTTLLAALTLCTTTINAGDVVYHKGLRLSATVHHINTQEGWATISATESSGQHFKVWLRDLDADTRVRIGVATPGEVLGYNARAAEAAALAALQAQQDREDRIRAQVAQAAAQARQQAERYEAQRLAMQQQMLDLQRRQTEATEQAAFLQFLRSQQR